MTITDVEDVTEAMRDVVDPELGINVVDLGLVYGVHVDEANIATIDRSTGAVDAAAGRQTGGDENPPAGWHRPPRARRAAALP